MNKQDRLKHLPPAARVARVVYDEEWNSLMVKYAYVMKPRERGAQGVCGGELWGVPREVWVAHIGKILRLWEWHGTGEGMIGGPAKRQVGYVMWGGVAEFPTYHKKAELLEEAASLQLWLDDDRYEGAPNHLARVERKVRELRFYAEQPRWNRMDSSQRSALETEFFHREMEGFDGSLLDW